MKKTATLLFATVFLSLLAGNIFAQEPTLSNLGLAPYVKTNTDYSLSVNLINASGPDIESFSISWQLDGGTVNTYGPYNINGGLPSSGGYYLPCPLTSDFTVSAAGPHTVVVWGNVPGASGSPGDTITYTFIGLTNYAPKVVLLEECTAQWCEHCPPAGETTDSLSNFPYVAIARFHNTDNFSFQEEMDYYNRYYTVATGQFFPAGMVDMSELGNYTVNDNYPNWPGDVLAESGISPVELTDKSSFDPSTNTLTVTLTANYKYAEAGNYSFNCYILESGIVGNQENLTADDSEYLIQDFVHNNVVRALLGDSAGTPGIIPATPEVNTNYSYTYTIAIDTSQWHVNNLSLIGIVFNTVNGQPGAVNTVKSGLIATGIKNVQVDNLKVYPNPFTDGINISLPANSNKSIVSVYSVEGKLILEKEYTAVGNTTVYLDLSQKNLAAGFYTVMVKTENGTYSNKLIKN